MKHPKVEHEASRRGVCGGEMCLLPVQSGMLKGTWVLDGAHRASELHPARWETRAGAAGLLKAAGGTGAPFRTRLSTAGCFG